MEQQQSDPDTHIHSSFTEKKKLCEQETSVIVQEMTSNHSIRAGINYMASVYYGETYKFVWLSVVAQDTQTAKEKADIIFASLKCQ